MAHAEVIVRAPDRGRARAVRDLAGDAGSEIVDVSRLLSKVEAKITRRVVVEDHANRKSCTGADPISMLSPSNPLRDSSRIRFAPHGLSGLMSVNSWA